MKVSAAIITRNAAADLDRCLASLAFADEIVVLDQHSDDDTAAVCARHGAALHQSEWLGFGPLKRRVTGLCRNRWILSIDSDEEVSAELRARSRRSSADCSARRTPSRISPAFWMAEIRPATSGDPLLLPAWASANCCRRLLSSTNSARSR